VIIAVGVNDDGHREVLGMTVGASEAETFWTEFLRSLGRRGLRGVKLAISDAHEGLKAAVAKVLHASWQRCRVHTMRNLLAHAGRQGRGVAAAFIATAFAQDDAAAAKAQWRKVADQLRLKLPKLAAAMDEAEVDVLAYMDFPAAHRTKLHSTNSLERLNGEVKRRTDVVGIFPNEEAIGTGAKLGVRRQQRLAGKSRWLDGTSVRIRNQTYHYRPRTEPEAVGRRRAVTSAFADFCSSGGSPGNWLSLL
jgi:putative transposase